MYKNVIIATAATFLIFGSTAAFAGLSFKMVTTSNGKILNEAQVWVEGSSMKSEVVGGEQATNNPMMPLGSYMVVNEQGLFLVNTTERTFARFDISMFEDMAQAINQSGLGTSMEFKDIVVEKTIDEEGESIEGYATRHYQFKSSWTMVMAGSPMTTQSSSVQDIWATDQLQLPEASASLTFDPSALPASVKELADAQGLKDVEGFPLRMITASSVKTDMGMGGGLAGRMAQRMMNRGMAAAGGGDTTTTVEAKEVEEVDVPAATFEIPADFTETQLFQTGPSVPDLNNLPDGSQSPQSSDVPNLDNIPQN